MKKYWVIFSASLILYLEGLLADFFYSNCVDIGSKALSCINHTQILTPLVISGSFWYLSPFQLIFGKISETMGIVSGIGFLGSVISFFLIRRYQISASLYFPSQRRFRAVLVPAFLDTVIVSSVLYQLAMIGFFAFLPFCLQFPCRITNYLTFVSYKELLIISGCTLVLGFYGKIFLYLRGHKRVEYPEIKREYL